MQIDISIWCLIATFVLIYIPRLPALQGTLRQEGRIDLGHPRIQQARLEGLGAVSASIGAGSSPYTSMLLP